MLKNAPKLDIFSIIFMLSDDWLIDWRQMSIDFKGFVGNRKDSFGIMHFRYIYQSTITGIE